MFTTKKKRPRPGGDDAAAGASSSSARQRSSAAREFLRELFVPVGPQQAYPPVTSSYIERSGHSAERKDSIDDDECLERMRPKSDAEVRREESWKKRRRERRPSLTLPPAENDEKQTSASPRRTSMTRRRSSAGSIASMILRRLSFTGNKDKSAPVSKKTSMTFGQFDDDDEDFVEEPTPTPSKPRQYVLIASRPALDQLRSSQFLTLAAFFAFHHSRNTWTLTTSRDFLAYLGDDETGNKYLAIFTLLTPASVLGLPFVDKIVHKFGFAAGLHVVNALAIGQGIIQVSSDNLNVQVVGFVLYSFYRCFLFSVCFSALPAFLDGIVLGKGYGLLIFSGGVLSLMNIPLSNAAVQKLGGNFFIPNLIYTVLCGPCIILVWMIHRGFVKEAEEKRRLKEVGPEEIVRESIDDNIDVSNDDGDADEVAEVIED